MKSTTKVQAKYTRKNLARRRKKNKKIMKTKNIRKDKRSCPKAKSVEEKILKLHHRPLAVLETSIISFSLIHIIEINW
jgi:hypothetical protein